MDYTRDIEELLNVNFGTEKHGTKLAKCLNDTQEFFFDSGVIPLSRIELASIISNGATVLLNDGAKLTIASVGLDNKREVMIRIGKESVRRNDCFHDGLDNVEGYFDDIAVFSGTTFTSTRLDRGLSQ